MSFLSGIGRFLGFGGHQGPKPGDRIPNYPNAGRGYPGEGGFPGGEPAPGRRKLVAPGGSMGMGSNSMPAGIDAPVAEPKMGGIGGFLKNNLEVIPQTIGAGAALYGAIQGDKNEGERLALAKKQQEDLEAERKRQIEMDRINMLMQGMVGFRPRY